MPRVWIPHFFLITTSYTKTTWNILSFYQCGILTTSESELISVFKNELSLSHYSTQSTFTYSHPISYLPFSPRACISPSSYYLYLLSPFPHTDSLLVLYQYRFQSSCSPKVAVVKVTTLNAVALYPMDIFQTLSYSPGMSDLQASSSWYARFTPLTSQDSLFPSSSLGSAVPSVSYSRISSPS